MAAQTLAGRQVGQDAVRPLPKRFTVEQYHRMGNAGILGEDDRVELLDGEIVDMSPIGARHADCVDRANQAFSRRVGEAAIVRVQSPIQLDDHSEPEPDLALLKPRRGGYATAHPGPTDVLLVVEVADTSAVYDRQVKLPHYARAGISEAWLLNVSAAGDVPGSAAGERDVLEVYRRPGPRGYAEIQVLRAGDMVTPQALPAITIPVTELLGEEA
jgi:Uma2 family endonuclease